MEQQYSQNNQPFTKPYRGTGFTTASLVCGILAIMSCMIFYVTIFFGAFSILFALLSRQDTLRMPGTSKIGIGLSIAAILITGAITVYSFIFLVDTFGLDMILNHPDQLLQELLQMMDDMTEMGGSANELFL